MEWDLPCVSLEWMYESIERGMILDEKLYSPSVPKEQRGRNAWIRHNETDTHLGKRQRPKQDAEADGQDLGPSRRKLRRTASSKTNQQSSTIWKDIGSYSVHSRQSSELVPQVARSISMPKPSFDQHSTVPERSAVAASANASGDHSPSRKLGTGLLVGRAFFIHGFPARKACVLRRHLESHGALVQTDPEESVAETFKQYLLVPHDISPSEASRRDLEMMRTSLQGAILVTEWWLERCLERKTIFHRSEVPGAIPFPCFPLDGMSAMKISCTGYLNMELKHISTMTELAGAKFSSTFTRTGSLLLCNPATMLQGEKIRAAWNWGVPTVSGRWLLDSMAQGRKLDIGPYLLQQPNQRSPRKGLPKAEMESRRAGQEAQKAGHDIALGELRATSPTDTEIRQPSTRNQPVHPPLSKATSEKPVAGQRGSPLRSSLTNTWSSRIDCSASKEPRRESSGGIAMRSEIRSEMVAAARSSAMARPEASKLRPLDRQAKVPLVASRSMECLTFEETSPRRPVVEPAQKQLTEDISSLLAYQAARRLQKTASELSAASESPSRSRSTLSRNSSGILTSGNSPSKAVRRKIFGKAAATGACDSNTSRFSKDQNGSATSKSSPQALASESSKELTDAFGWDVEEKPPKVPTPSPTQHLIYEDPEAKRYRDRIQRKTARLRAGKTGSTGGAAESKDDGVEKVTSPKRPMRAVDSARYGQSGEGLGRHEGSRRRQPRGYRQAVA